MNAAEAIAAMQKALDLLDAAEARYAAVRAENRRRYAHLGPAVADLRGRDDKPIRDANLDWQLAHDRIRSYAAAATALLLHDLATTRRTVRRAP